MIRVIAIVAAAVLLSLAAAAQPCSGNPQALGTERVLEADANTTPRIGRKQFPSTLPLNDKELVLTFDDGPWPTTTPKVLDALKYECVQATFFLLGRNVQAHPAIARRELAEGHSLGHHTFSHPLLSHMPLAKAGSRSTAASRPTNMRSMASVAAIRRRRSSTFPALSPAPHCSATCRTVASSYSAPTSGPATGCP
jgi:hypothetical protein